MKTNLTVEIVKITPELAANYLKFNVKNRKTSEKHISFLTKEMKEGRFLENGEGIKFDKYGELKDGQHRLKAIVISGKSYYIPVIRGVEPLAMATYDTGKNRSANDVLKINGFSYSNIIAPIIIKIDTYKRNNRQQSAGSRRDYLTNQQVLEYCSENYEWLLLIARKVDEMGKKQTKPQIMSKANLGLMVYMLGGENPNKTVYDFLNHIIGLSRTAESATNYVYTKLYNSKVNKEPLNFYWVLGMVIKAYNYFIEGNPPVKYFAFKIEQDLPKVNNLFNV